MSNPITSEQRLGGCTLSGALAVTAFITDAVTVVHAPNGCTHQIFSMLHALCLDAGIVRTSPVLSSGITDTDVIFGAESALSRALDRAAEQNPNLICVVTSCVPETIGDDCAGICATHPYAAKIRYIPTSGFLGGTAEDGENTALIELAKIAEPADIMPYTAILIGEKNLESEVEENYAEIVRLLNRLNIKVTLRFCRNIRTEDIGILGTAACYIIRDSRVLRAGTAIAQRFGRPYIAEFPRGLSGAVTFLKEAGTACGLSADIIEQAIADEYAYQETMLIPFAELTGTSVNPGAEPFAGTLDIAREAMRRTGIRESPDGMPVKLPFYLPVGVSGTVKMLYLWRREHRK